MFGIGMPELIIIMVIALIVIGPSKLPDLAKALGKGLMEFKKATSEIKDSLNMEEELKDAKEDLIDSVSGLDRSFGLNSPSSIEEEKQEKPEAEDEPGVEEKDDTPEDVKSSESESGHHVVGLIETDSEKGKDENG